MKKCSLICSSLLVLALTLLISVSASAQAFDPLRISGFVDSFTPSDCGKPGSITIGGQTLVIAAGADVVFFDTMQVINSSGLLAQANVISEVWQVNRTGRTLGVYLDPQNRIRLEVLAGLNTTTVRSLDITGVVTAFTAATATTAGSVTIHGLIFPVAPGSTVPVAVAANLVRLIGTLNASNQLTVTTVGDPYRKLTICGAPANYRSVGGFEVGDVNAFDAAGPIAAVVPFNSSPTTPFNPLGSTGGFFQCDQSFETMTVDGATSVPFAPNFSISNQISKDVYACFELNIDALNWASNGSRKLSTANVAKGGSVQGILEATVNIPPAGNLASLSEANQQGRITISGRTFIVAAGVNVPLNGAVANANPPQTVCLQQVVDPSGQTGQFLPGQVAPPRAGQLINGTFIKPGACMP